MAARRYPLRQLQVHPTDPGVFLLPLTKGYFGLVSAVDAEAVGQSNWHAAEKCGVWYAQRSYPDRTKKQMLHRFIAERSGLVGPEVDHINRNGLDCRRSNLRSATPGQNRRNMKLPAHNTSGVKGVSWCARDRRWKVQIWLADVNHRYGSFVSFDEAVAVASAARKQLHGEFASEGT